MFNNIAYKKSNNLLLVIIFILMIFGYVNIVSPVFRYSGFLYTMDIYKIIESSLLFFVTFFIVNKHKKPDIVYSINILVFVFMSMPNYVIYMFMDVPKAIIYSYALLHFSLLVISFPKFNIKVYLIRSNIESKILLLLTLLLLIPFFIRYGFRLNFNVLLLQDIYEVRAESAQNINVFTSYFYSWLTRVVLPFTIVYGFIKKKRFFIIIGVMASLYLFLVAAHKSVFFGLLMLLFLNFFKGYQKKIFILLLSVIIVFLLGIFIFFVFDKVEVASMFLRRVFFLPALLNNYYFDFFDGNHLHLSHSILKNYFDYPYSHVPSHIIGLNYFDSVNMGANNGIISDGFMNFGYVGILINIVIFSFIVKYFQAIHLNQYLFPIVFLFLFSLNSSALLTVLLTHGLLLFILMTIFYNKRLNKF